MSKICMTLCSSSGTWLKDCLQPQHYFVSLSIEDPEGKILARVGLSFEQAARMLLYNGDVECTLQRYRDASGALVEEKVVPPETVHQRMKDRLGETQNDLKKRMEDLYKDVYAMMNGDIKPGKKALADLLNDISTIQSHYRENEAFMVQQAQEELAAMQSNAAGQLGMFLQAQGLDVSVDDLKKMLPSGVPEDAPKMIAAPVVEGYKLKERPKKEIKDMTAREVADQMSIILRFLESKQDKDKERNPLFSSSAHEATGSKVSIRYVNYQGTSTISLEEAKEYLKFLTTVKSIEDFKTHHWYKGENK